jgi:serine/threonine-protein kinase RsbW
MSRANINPANRLSRLELRLTSDPAAIAPARVQVEHFARTWAYGEKEAADIGLVLNEALANVIRHAYQGATDRPILLTVSFESGALTISLRDWGTGVNPMTLPEKKHDPCTPGGLGLVCLRQLMDHVVFTPQPDGMLLTMVRRHGGALLHKPGGHKRSA